MRLFSMDYNLLDVESLQSLAREYPVEALYNFPARLNTSNLLVCVTQAPQVALRKVSSLLPKEVLLKLVKKYPAHATKYCSSLLPEVLLKQLQAKVMVYNITRMNIKNDCTLPYEMARKKHIHRDTQWNLLAVAEVLGVTWKTVEYTLASPERINIDGSRKGNRFSFKVHGEDKQGFNIMYYRKEKSFGAGSTDLYFEGKNPIVPGTLIDSFSKKDITFWKGQALIWRGSLKK